MSFLRRFDKWFGFLLDGCLTILLVGMLLGAIIQVIARNLFGSGLDWLDILVRHTVLWLGLIGAISATRVGNHIRIDAFVRLIPLKFRKWIQLTTSILTASICIWLMSASLEMIETERQAGTKLIGEVSTIVVLWIFPISFFLIALFSIIHSILHHNDIDQEIPSS